MADTTGIKPVPVVFDVLGTLFSLNALADEIGKYMDHDPRQLTEDLFHSAQRDFTYLSMNGQYTSIAQVIKATLFRSLVDITYKGVYGPEHWKMTQAARRYIENGSVGDLPEGLRDEAEVRAVVEEYEKMKQIPSAMARLDARPLFKEAVDILSKDSAFSLVAATNGGLESTQNLLRRALGDEGEAKWKVFSCDQIKVAKPAPAVYEAVWELCGAKENKDRFAYYVASHTWDLFAAKKAGFKTVWLSYEEYDPCTAIFGEPDIIADTLEEAAQKIVEAEKARR